MRWRQQLLQRNMDSVRKWIDPAYQGIELIKSATKANTGPANAIDSLPVPTPQPPITPADPQVLAAQQNFAKKTLGQKTVSDTIKAGDTGGFQPGAPGYPGNPGVGPASFKRKL